MILTSLGLERAALSGRLYRLSLMTAAGGTPALDDDAWRAWIVGWMQERGVLLLIVDTATNATRIDPWGEAIRALFRNLRLMLDAYPELAIVLTVHLKKPQGRGDRRISDVIGEWGRWADVLVLQENVGSSLTQTRLTIRKRVRTERRIVATKAGGLLVDASDADAPTGPKVPLEEVVAAIAGLPGLGLAGLGASLGVSKSTAGNYAEAAEAAGLIERRKGGPKGAIALFPSEGPRNRATPRIEADYAVPAQLSLADRATAQAHIEDARSALRGGSMVGEESEAELLAQARGASA